MGGPLVARSVSAIGVFDSSVCALHTEKTLLCVISSLLTSQPCNCVTRLVVGGGGGGVIQLHYVARLVVVGGVDQLH